MDPKPTAPFFDQLLRALGSLCLLAVACVGWCCWDIWLEPILLLIGLAFLLVAVIRLGRPGAAPARRILWRAVAIVMLVIVPVLSKRIHLRAHAFSLKHQFSEVYFSLLQKDCDALILLHAKELHALEAAGDAHPSIDFRCGGDGYALLPGSVRQLDPDYVGISLDYVSLARGRRGQLTIYRTGLGRFPEVGEEEIAKGIYYYHGGD